MTILGHVAVSALLIWGLSVFCWFGEFYSEFEHMHKWMRWYRLLATWSFYIGAVILFICALLAIWGIR